MNTVQLIRETKALLKTLPPQSEWEDLMYRIYVTKKVDAGLKESSAGQVFSTAQVRKKLKLAS
jgi:hypothetical protein